jgi:NAD(P)-dependent dehydrogenase (short-subunit alcohol dehydrogenase family)
MSQLNDIIALVTGASRGAGRGIALELGTLARDYGFTDIDGTQPPSFRIPAST